MTSLTKELIKINYMKLSNEEVKIFQKVKPFLIDLGYDEESLTLDVSFSNELGMDSLDLADLMMQMEVMFEISISYEEVENRGKTLVDLVRLIADKVLDRSTVAMSSN